MENAMMIGVLLAVVGVGLFGLYFASSTGDSGTMYVPVITGMSAFAQLEADIIFNSLVGISLSGGNCSATYPILNVTPQQTANLAYFDTFGASAYATYYDVIQAPCDGAYGGNASLNGTLLAIIEDLSNTYLTTKGKLNASLPTGFQASYFTVIPFNTNTTPTGTYDFYARDSLANTTFDSANDEAWTTSNQYMLCNWSDGTGKGGDPAAKYSIATSWEYYPYQVAAGTYHINYDFIATETWGAGDCI